MILYRYRINGKTKEIAKKTIIVDTELLEYRGQKYYAKKNKKIVKEIQVDKAPVNRNKPIYLSKEDDLKAKKMFDDLFKSIIDKKKEEIKKLDLYRKELKRKTIVVD